ncbi:hypothetical protein ZIOFF_049293 [Zingiber officinale]|uniref:Ammonium transporter AmtB-like domain-containing protein n=1 Tax=Zingiber officinale TaxID=94328 RepID=A0A8J5FY00_ZINOF|nr:hypothetical protein ZIOFF_049293 [Zingiber officinale]
MGVLFSSIPWFTVMILHKRTPFLRMIDNTLIIFHTHYVGGTLGGILTGVLAEPCLNCLFFGDDPKYVSLACAIKDSRASAEFMQLASIAFVLATNVVVTNAICLLIRLLVSL